jgi:hypothetical protein
MSEKKQSVVDKVYSFTKDEILPMGTSLACGLSAYMCKSEPVIIASTAVGGYDLGVRIGKLIDKKVQKSNEKAFINAKEKYKSKYINRKIIKREERSKFRVPIKNNKIKQEKLKERKNNISEIRVKKNEVSRKR